MKNQKIYYAVAHNYQNIKFYQVIYLAKGSAIQECERLNKFYKEPKFTIKKILLVEREDHFDVHPVLVKNKPKTELEIEQKKEERRKLRREMPKKPSKNLGKMFQLKRDQHWQYHSGDLTDNLPEREKRQGVLVRVDHNYYFLERKDHSIIKVKKFSVIEV